jgi:dTDP-4-dehydrorhamnose 3,5-epimerase
MSFESELLPGTWHIGLESKKDLRGTFLKTFSASNFSKYKAEMSWREEFYSISHKNVIRGMHFQIPPYEHYKFVYCLSGSVLDVLLDLRQDNYGKCTSLILQGKKPSVLLIPPGIAHGFLSLRDGTVMIYKTSTEYNSLYDSGIDWSSFGFDWGVTTPIISNRDKRHPRFEGYISPFIGLK